MQTYGASFSYVNPWAMNESINMIWMNPYAWQPQTKKQRE